MVIKRADYQSHIDVFPDSEGEFDRKIAAYAKQIIIIKYEELQNPTQTKVATEIGMLRTRLSRLIHQLGLERTIKNILEKKKN